MAIFDIFKKKKEETGKKPASAKATAAKGEKKAPKVKIANPKLKKERKEEKKEEIISSPAKPSRKKIEGAAYKILRFPHVTEKATDLAERNQYIFKVYDRTNKSEVKKAVENNYGVNVVGVRIINIKGKKIILGGREGYKKGYKKAIVEVAKGEKIEILPR